MKGYQQDKRSWFHQYGKLHQPPNPSEWKPFKVRTWTCKRMGNYYFI